MQDFLTSYWSTIVAGLLALFSFLLLHFGAQAKAETRNAEIETVVKESVDLTIDEMKNQIGTVIGEVENSSEKSMNAIKDTGIEIIGDLKSDSKNATEEIKSETRKVVKELDDTSSKIKVSTDYITKKLQFDEVNLTVFFKATLDIDDATGFGGQKVYKFLESYTSQHLFTLQFNEGSYDIEFRNLDKEFGVATSWEDLNSRKASIYFTDQQEYHPSGGDPTFQINFRFNLISMQPKISSGKYKNYLRLSEGIRGSTNFRKPVIVNGDKIKEINPTQAIFKLNDGSEFRYKFDMKQPSSVVSENPYMIYEFERIE